MKWVILKEANGSPAWQRSRFGATLTLADWFYRSLRLWLIHGASSASEESRVPQLEGCVHVTPVWSTHEDELTRAVHHYLVLTAIFQTDHGTIVELWIEMHVIGVLTCKDFQLDSEAKVSLCCNVHNCTLEHIHMISLV